MPTVLRPGVHKFVVRAAGNHFIEMGRLLPGKTVADFKAWIEATKEGQNVPPPIDESASMDTPALSPGHSITWHYKLPRGNYVLACFWPDADMGGMPHAFMGMYRGIKLR